MAQRYSAPSGRRWFNGSSAQGRARQPARAGGRHPPVHRDQLLESKLGNRSGGPVHLLQPENALQLRTWRGDKTSPFGFNVLRSAQHPAHAERSAAGSDARRSRAVLRSDHGCFGRVLEATPERAAPACARPSADVRAGGAGGLGLRAGSGDLGILRIAAASLGESSWTMLAPPRSRRFEPLRVPRAMGGERGAGRVVLDSRRHSRTP